MSANQHPQRSPLRLFAPDKTMRGRGKADPHTLTISTDCTLRQVYERAFVPLWMRPQALSPKTAALYSEALAWWERLTGNPTLAQIDDFCTARFVEQLLAQPGRKRPTLAIATVRKHCALLDKLLDFCGPKTRDRHRRKNLGLLADPPILDRPTADCEPPAGDFSLDEVRAICAQCGGMTLPRVDGITAPAWWQALITTAVFTGLRIGQLMRLAWADLQPPYVLVWSRNSKGRRGKKQYLPAEVLADLEAIRTERTLIFEFRNWEKNPRWLQQLWKRLCQRAGLPKARQFGFHGLRKLHATLLADAAPQANALTGGLTGVSLAQASLGHTSDSTTSQHYVSGKVQDKIVAAALDRLPSPKPTRQRRDDPRQGLLFEL